MCVHSTQWHAIDQKCSLPSFVAELIVICGVDAWPQPDEYHEVWSRVGLTNYVSIMGI